MVLYITEENIEIVDVTPEAGIRLDAMEYVEERIARERKHRKKDTIIKKIVSILL